MSSDTTTTGPEDDASVDVADPSTDPAHETSTEPAASADRTRRWASRAFLAYLAVAFVFLVVVVAPRRWFIADEWGFLSGRTLGGLDDLVDPQNQHWSTAPIVAYRVLYRVFGLHSYLPYLLPVIVLHLSLAGLLRATMRRWGVSPWIATAAAATYVLYGPGYDNLVLAVQMSMVGSMVCGFAWLLLADHDGPLDRRDWLGVAIGIFSLTTSGIAIPLAVGVGVAVLIRRGPRAFAFHVVPPALVYGIWYLSVRSDFVPYDPGGSAGIGTLVWWVYLGISGVFLGLGHFPVLAVALAAVVIVGLVLAWKPLGWRQLRRQAGGALGLVAAAVVLFAVVASGRWWLGDWLARTSRYTGLATAMLLPAVAIGAQAVCTRWRRATAVVVALLLVPVPFNAWQLDQVSRDEEVLMVRQREQLLSASVSPLLADAPADAVLDPGINAMQGTTAGWLRSATAAGKLPVPDRVPPLQTSAMPLHLQITRKPLNLDRLVYCRERSQPLTLQVAEGDRLVIDRPVFLSVNFTDERASLPQAAIWFDPIDGQELTFHAPMNLLLQRVHGQPTYSLCTQ